MAITYIKTKDGKTYSGPIYYWRPMFNWFSIITYGDNKKGRFTFDECESIITPNERVSINSPITGEICDEFERARKNLEDGRRLKWTERDEDGVMKPYPTEKFNWEMINT